MSRTSPVRNFDSGVWGWGSKRCGSVPEALEESESHLETGHDNASGFP